MLQEHSAGRVSQPCSAEGATALHEHTARAHQHSPADAVYPSTPLHSPLIHSRSHDISQLLPKGLKMLAAEVGEYCH